MNTNKPHRVALFPGDGIGPEVMAPCIEVLDAALARAGAPALDYEPLPGGARHYREHGEALPEAAFAAAEAADAILFGAMGLPDVRYPDGTEIAPQLDLRFRLQLYAGVRPVRMLAGVPAVLSDARAGDIDFVIVRESTEGLFSTRGRAAVEDDRVARDVMEITRETSEKLFEFTFRLAERRRRRGRPGRVTCVDKANILTSMAFFRKVFDECRARHPTIAADHRYVDAAALDLVRRPWDYDVMVTENMFGDILSDLAAGLIGGMGLAPSADIGDRHAVFQPCHGSAPDIAGRGLANPVAMFLSGAMMLDWLGERHDIAALIRAAGLVERAVERTLAAGAARPVDIGGEDGTDAVTAAVLAAIDGEQ